jgi:mono/diheme cytochrome c family protein/plastocyanin
MLKVLKEGKFNLPEVFARGIVVGLLLTIVIGLGYQKWRASAAAGERVIEIHARMPEAGGWTPAELTARAGETIHLRLTSDDVVHGFAIGGEEFASNPISLDVEPGKVSEVTLNFDKPGKYTFYCTRWCGLNHWRMRGSIEVSGAESKSVEQAKPLYLQLGLDIDAAHPAGNVPAVAPSAGRGALLGDSLPEDYRSREYYRAHSPAQVWEDLRAEPGLRDLTSAELWDLVAFIWWSNTTPEAIREGEQLFASNCAACHGESGAGDGVMAGRLEAAGAAISAGEHESGHKPVEPADFTRVRELLGASPALLQGKILRGGMGTGMPYWGPILSEAQTWEIVDYLWTFQFSEEP